MCVFVTLGLHLRTFNTVTKHVEFQFLYDESEKLIGVIDRYNRYIFK